MPVQSSSKGVAGESSYTDSRGGATLTPVNRLPSLALRALSVLLIALCCSLPAAASLRTESGISAAPSGPLGRGEARPGGTPARSAAERSEDGASTRRITQGSSPVGDYAKNNAAVALTVIAAPVEVIKDVANFGDHFAEAVFANNDHEAGRKALKPVATAMSATAMVLGARVKTNTPRACPCFSPETLVASSEGLRPISEIRVGDLVLARDPDSGITSYKSVTRVFVTPERDLVELRVRGEGGAIETIHTTLCANVA
jgi:hypothetical protein